MHMHCLSTHTHARITRMLQQFHGHDLNEVIFTRKQLGTDIPKQNILGLTDRFTRDLCNDVPNQTAGRSLYIARHRGSISACSDQTHAGCRFDCHESGVVWFRFRRLLAS